jgi:hypothetical protein
MNGRERGIEDGALQNTTAPPPDQGEHEIDFTAKDAKKEKKGSADEHGPPRPIVPVFSWRASRASR